MMIWDGFGNGFGNGLWEWEQRQDQGLVRMGVERVMWRLLLFPKLRPFFFFFLCSYQ